MSEQPGEIRYFFIRRPVLAAVISIVITLLGGFALIRLPINRFPQITPPAVQVTAIYPGANAEDVAQAVAAPIEQQLSGLDGLLYYQSANSSTGVMSLSVYFDISRDQDLAAVEVQNAVKLAEPQLPEEVRRQGIVVQKTNTNILLVAALVSDDPRYDALYLNNYATLYVGDELKRVPGVGNAQIFGGADFSMLMSLDPEKMAHLGITVDDVAQAVREQNVTNPAGRLGREPAPKGTQLTLPVITSGRLTEAAQFGDIIVRSRPDGSVVRVSDIARVHLGAQSYDAGGRLSGRPTAFFLVYARPGANQLRVRDAVEKRLEELQKGFPQGIKYAIPFDTTPFITTSMEEVVKTLIEAMILVTLVVFLFLESWRATVIPILAVPVSIIGTFLGLQILGFTINTLTLFGLVLAIGIVVDDAIVVIENVERIMEEEGLPPRQAADKAIRQVSGALVAIVLSLCAVFVPVAFISGITGAMYKEFALTIVIAIVISGIVALTLTPALCATLLRHTTAETHNRFFQAFNRGFDRIRTRYLGAAGRIVARPRTWMAVFLVAVVLTLLLFRKVPGAFIPLEDKGFFVLAVQLPDAASRQRTEDVVTKVEKIVLADSSIRSTVTLIGLDLLTFSQQTNSATMFVRLKPWDERKGKNQSLDAILARINGQLFGIKEALSFGFNFPEIPGLGRTSGLEMNLQARTGVDYRDFAAIAQNFVRDANALPEVQGAVTQIRADVPQVYVKVDKDAAYARGVGPGQIFSTLQAMLSSLYINDFNLAGRTYRVQAEAETEFRQKPEDIGRFYVRSNHGDMVPLSALVSTEMRGGPSIISRFNGFPSALVTAQPKPGKSSGQLIAAVERLVAEKYASQGIGYGYSGQTFQERISSGSSALVIVLGLIMVFLVLAAQYESFAIPFAVLLGVPFGVFGALLGAWFRGMANDVYFQVGMIAVIGLAAKNAILIVEFANELLAQGYSVKDAAREAARQRLRPILMTSLAFILGVTPLVVAGGAGAASRHSIGTGVFAGMLVATMVGVFFIPLFFSVIAGLTRRGRAAAQKTPSSWRRADMRAALLALLTLAGACAVGPSTGVHQPTPAAVRPVDSLTGRASRAFLDSLANARMTDHRDSLPAVGAAQPLRLDSLSDRPWLTVLDDSVLISMVEAAMSGNQDLKIAVARVQEYRALVGVARGDLFPQITANGSGSTNQSIFGAFPAQKFDAVRVTADLGWELDFWGRIRRQTEAAGFDRDAQEEAERSTVVTLVSDVVTAYLELRELDQELSISEETLETRRASLALARRRFAEGVISELDVRQFESEAAVPAARVADFARQRAEKEHEISVLLGRAPGPLPRGKPLAETVKVVLIPDSIPGDLLLRRPDVRRAERDLQAATARVGLALGNRLPRVTITGEYGRQRPDFHDLFGKSAEVYFAQLGISLPLFTGGKLLNQQRAARARVDQARARYEAAVLNALREGDDALVGLRLTKDQLVAQNTQVLALTRAFELARRRYENGVSSYLEVLDSQRGLFQAQLTLAETERQYLGATVRLYKALGGGWASAPKP